MSRVAAALALAACSSKSEPPAPRPVTVVDAGIDGITKIGNYDPSSGMHLDGDGSGGAATSRPRRERPSKPIDVMLRTTPSGAEAEIDGVSIGITPTYWPGDADGREHVFSFRRPGFAVAIYKFVPVTSGIIHVRLEPVVEDNVDAGVSLTPPPPPMAIPVDAAVLPPPTVLSIDAGGLGPPP